MITVERSVLRKGCIGYKVAPYQHLDHLQVWRSSLKKEEDDWSGHYVAKTRSVAAGYRYDYEHPYGHTVTLLHDVKILVCKGPELEDVEITGAEKAKMIINALPSEIKAFFNKKILY